MKRIVFVSLLSGLLINVCDVTLTVTTVATDWNSELSRQGIAPNPFTPPYYVSASFVAGSLLVWLYRQLARSRGATVHTAMCASALLWGISRLYGGGHVVMGQMPAWIFAIMSFGLLLGFVVAGQVVRLLLRNEPGSAPGPLDADAAST
jgi:hypothetical protein